MASPADGGSSESRAQPAGESLRAFSGHRGPEGTFPSVQGAPRSREGTQRPCAGFGGRSGMPGEGQKDCCGHGVPLSLEMVTREIHMWCPCTVHVEYEALVS